MSHRNYCSRSFREFKNTRVIEWYIKKIFWPNKISIYENIRVCIYIYIKQSVVGLQHMCINVLFVYNVRVRFFSYTMALYQQNIFYIYIFFFLIDVIRQLCIISPDSFFIVLFVYVLVVHVVFFVTQPIMFSYPTKLFGDIF